MILIIIIRGETVAENFSSDNVQCFFILVSSQSLSSGKLGMYIPKNPHSILPIFYFHFHLNPLRPLKPKSSPIF